jgi:hypothetical protein
MHEVSPHNYIPLWRSELATGMVRVNYAGDTVFYLDGSSRLWMLYYAGGWHSAMISATGAAIVFTGPFDITPEFGKDNAQVYFRGSDGYMHVVFMWGGEWLTGHILCEPEPVGRQCMSNGYIRNNKAVIYQGVFPADAGGGAWRYNNFRAYYYGKGDATDE